MNASTEHAPDLRFDGRVAIVTGAGRGLGRAHALLLAARGAKVIVNDLGGSKDGDGNDDGPANEVVAEIVEAGGVAAPDTNDVGSEEGCYGIVATAIREFGRIDIVVNNAGISRWASFPEADAENLERTLDVHLRGTWHTTRAAWPYMVKQGYGRVITTTSTGMLGLPDNLAYATAKGALIGFTRSLSVTAAPHGILVNCIAPNSVSRTSASAVKANAVTAAPANPAYGLAMQTEFVSPMVGYLAHESCAVNGEIIVAGAKRFSRWFLGITPGWVDETDGPTSLEDIAAHWNEINEQAGYYVPESTNDWGGRFLAHVR